MSIDRRMVLRGAAASLFLPFLPSAMPRAAWGQDITAPRRALWWFTPNGILSESFVPTTVGSTFDLPKVLEPMESLRNRMTVLSNVENYAAYLASSFPTHESCTSSLLTDSAVTTGGALKAGVSIDQHIAATVGGNTPFPSLQLASGEPYISGFGNIDIYYSTISWASEQTPMVNLTKPQVLFERMFGGEDSDLTEAEQEKRAELRTSVLDVVLERSNQLSSKLSQTDKYKLDQYQTGIRELELRIQQLADLQCVTPEEPPASVGFAETVEIMSDLMVVALECDLTRVITWMSGSSTAESVYDFLDINTTHHTLSHNWSFDNVAKQELLAIQAWQMEMFTALAQKLADKPDSNGGNVLDHTAMLFCTEFGESNLHYAEPVPFVLAGGEAAGWAQGQHRAMDGAPHANLMRAMGDFMGVTTDGWGSTSDGIFDFTS